MPVAVGKYALMVWGRKKAWRTKTKAPAMSKTARSTAVIVTRRLRVAIGQISWSGNPVDWEGQLGAWPSVVRRLACVHAAAEPEDVVQERLQDLRWRNVGYERVVIRTVRHDLALSELVFGQARDRLGQIVPVLYQHRVDAIQAFKRRRQLLLVVGNHAG